VLPAAFHLAQLNMPYINHNFVYRKPKEKKLVFLIAAGIKIMYGAAAIFKNYLFTYHDVSYNIM